MNITFTIPITPMSTQFGGKRMCITGGKPRFFKTAQAENYQQMIRILARKHAPKTPLTGPLAVDFIFILPRPKSLYRKADPDDLIPCHTRPDRDNLQKGTQDALSDFWKDDGQIYDGRTTKFFAEKDGSPRIVVSIREQIASQAQQADVLNDPRR